LRTAIQGKARGGFTLLEVCLAGALLCAVSVLMCLAGSSVVRMARFNKVSLTARTLAVRMMEEFVSGRPHDKLELGRRVAATNYLQHGEEIVRTLQIIGHRTDRRVTTVPGESAYLEVHVRAVFRSPLTGKPVTQTASTLVGGPAFPGSWKADSRQAAPVMKEES
jgi:hypothetical protein